MCKMIKKRKNKINKIYFILTINIVKYNILNIRIKKT